MITEDGEPLVIYGVFRFTRGKGHSKTDARDFLCLGYRASGSSVFESNGKRIDIEENTAVFIGNSVGYSQESDGEDVIAVHFDTYERRTIDIIEKISSDNPRLIHELFINLYETWTNKREGYKTKCLSLLYSIIHLSAASDDTSLSGVSKSIKRAVAYIDSNFADPSITIKDIAKLANVSEVYFRRVFTNKYGISPLKYIIKMRVEYAKELLMSGYYSVSEAALMAGFNDSKYFSTCFKHEIGASPGRFKA